MLFRVVSGRSWRRTASAERSARAPPLGQGSFGCRARADASFDTDGFGHPQRTNATLERGRCRLRPDVRPPMPVGNTRRFGDANVRRRGQLGVGFGWPRVPCEQLRATAAASAEAGGRGPEGTHAVSAVCGSSGPSVVAWCFGTPRRRWPDAESASAPSTLRTVGDARFGGKNRRARVRAAASAAAGADRETGTAPGFIQRQEGSRRPRWRTAPREEESSEGRNPMSGSGMKQGRQARGGSKRREVVKT
jgi:hypothetical protein